jgi:hypothetical protein
MLLLGNSREVLGLHKGCGYVENFIIVLGVELCRLSVSREVLGLYERR